MEKRGEGRMRWCAISRSWRKVNKKVKKDVEDVVIKILKKGDGIVTGGALGVDYIATKIVLAKGDPKKQLKIFIPIKFKDFCFHYIKRAREGAITTKQARMICFQLQKIKKNFPKSIIDSNKYIKADKESYYARNTLVIKNSDALYAFQVNSSKGTQDAINKTKKMGKEVFIKKY